MQPNPMFARLYQRSGRVTSEPLTIYQGNTAVWTLDTQRHQLWNDIQQFAYPLDKIEWEFMKCSLLARGLRMDFYPNSIVWFLDGQESLLCTLPKDGLAALDCLQAYSLARNDCQDPLSPNGPLGALGLLSELPPHLMQSSAKELQELGFEFRPSKRYLPL